MTNKNLEQQKYINYFAYMLAFLALVFIMSWKLLPALLAGLLIHELVHIISPLVMRYGKIKRRAAEIAVVAIFTVIVVAILTVILIALIHFFRSGNENLPALLKKMAQILETSLPTWVLEKIPQDVAELKKISIQWLRDHASEITTATKHTLRIFAHIFLGMIIGAMIALHEIGRHEEPRPLSRALTLRANYLATSFRQVVFAQIKIAAINTVFTGLYLVVILPLLGIKLDFLVTMIVLTFLFGLLPVIGNLLSNIVIVVVSFTASFNVAIGSLVFLIVIHKVEYFLNAKIIGTQIKTKAWEILLAMITLEALFGVSGVIAAPILYAYLKKELKKSELV